MLLKGLNFYNNIITKAVFNIVDWDSAMQVIYYNKDNEKVLMETYNYLEGDIDALQRGLENNNIKVEYMLRIVEDNNNLLEL